MTQKEARGWLTARGVAAIVAGLAIFVALVWKTGPAEVRDGILKVGWMFPVILALGGLRFLARAIAWTLCVEPPQRLRVRDAFAAVLAGDALSNATPLGPVVGEPAKAAYVRRRLPAVAALAALAVENVYYSMSTAAIMAGGMVAMLFAFEISADIREYSEIAVGLLLLLVGAACAVLWAQPAVVTRHIPLGVRRGPGLAAGLLEVAFHALGVLETHLTLMMILPASPPLLVSFIMEAAGRLITVLFRFVPFGQLGVAEAGLAAASELLGLGTKPGLTLAIVRKARIGVWAALGAFLLARHGITPAGVRSSPDLPHPRES